LQGVFGPLARLNEQAFLVVIKESIKDDLKFLFCIKEETVENKTYLTFLRSSTTTNSNLAVEEETPGDDQN